MNPEYMNINHILCVWEIKPFEIILQSDLVKQPVLVIIIPPA